MCHRYLMSLKRLKIESLQQTAVIKASVTTDVLIIGCVTTEERMKRVQVNHTVFKHRHRFWLKCFIKRSKRYNFYRRVAQFFWGVFHAVQTHKRYRGEPLPPLGV